MTTLRDRLNEELKQAMKARDELKLSVIRMVRSAVKNREIERKAELDDQGIQEVVSTLVKQRRESIRLYTEGNRSDLADKEQQELDHLLSFLPQQLSREEVAAIVDEVIARIQPNGVKDLGKVMKEVQPRIAGRADGKLVSDTVREKLS